MREVRQEAEVGSVGKNPYGGFHGRNRQGRVNMFRTN